MLSPALRGLCVAIGTLTVIPITVAGEIRSADVKASHAWYPLVGLIVGAPPALAMLLPLDASPRAVLALTLWVVITGGLHLDGWLDCCDAAFAPPAATPAETRRRRLDILSDPRAGTFGVAGVVLLLLGKWTALAGTPALAPLLAAPVARWAMLLPLRMFAPARTTGLAAHAGRAVLRLPTLSAAAACAVPLALFVRQRSPGLLLCAVVAGGMAALFASVWLCRRFGGVTGDVCGASGEAAELVILWALLPWGGS